MPVLIQSRGPESGSLFEIRGNCCVIGRQDDCEIRVAGDSVSRRHCQLLLVGGRCYVEDLGSRNGTSVNSKRITSRTHLTSGDQLYVGGVEFEFIDSFPGAAEETLGNKAVVRDELPAMSFDDAHRAEVVSTAKVSSESGEETLAAGAERKLRALVETLSHLGTTLDEAALLDGLLSGLVKVFPSAARAFVARCEEDNDHERRVVPLSVLNVDGVGEDTSEIRISRTIVDCVMDSGEAVLSSDIAIDPRFNAAASIADLQLRSFLCAPLVDAHDEPLGFIQIESAEDQSAFDARDLEVLAAIAPQAARGLAFAQLHAEALRRQALDRDLELANDVQRRLLPPELPEVPGYKLYGFYEPAFQVGGDFYDVVHLSGERLAVVVADVAGKGVSAALLMAKLSGEIKYHLSSQPTAAAAAEQMNESLVRHSTAGRFVTMVVAVLETQTGQVTLVNAGHLAPVWKSVPGTAEDVGAETRGLALGILEDQRYDEMNFTLAPGELMVFYTDGFSEAENAADELYGADRLRAAIGRADATAEAAAEALLEDVREFTGGHHRSDDMCLVCLSRD